MSLSQRDPCIPPLSPLCYLASLVLWTVAWLSLTSQLLSTYSKHTIFTMGFFLENNYGSVRYFREHIDNFLLLRPLLIRKNPAERQSLQRAGSLLEYVPKHWREFWLPGNFKAPGGKQSNHAALFWIKRKNQPTTLPHFPLGHDLSLSVELQRETESSGVARKTERKIGTLH